MDWALFAFGFILGIAFGIAPGLHPNLAFSLLLSMGLRIDALSFLAGFIPSNAIFDALPSVLIGSPEGGRGISAFESKMLFSKGMGYYGILKTAWTAFLGFVFSVLLYPVGSFLIGRAYGLISHAIPWIVAGVALANIMLDLPHSILLFSLSGMLGYLSLNSFHSSEFTLGPLLTGLFGMPAILLSFGSKPAKQTKQFPLHDNFRGVFVAAVLGMFSSLLPALGASQLMFITAPLSTDFISFSSSLSSSSTMFSLLTVEKTGKARTGAAVFLSKNMPLQLFPLFLLSSMSASLSLLIITAVAWPASKMAGRFSDLFNIVSLLLIITITFLTTGFHGFLVLISATALGTYAWLSPARKTHLLGCLIFPTLAFYISRLF